MFGLFYLFSILIKSEDIEVDGFTYSISDNKATVINCSVTEDVLTIPSYVIDSSSSYPVTSIAQNAFASTNNTFTEVYFPSTLTQISDFTFQKFLYLEKIGYINDQNETIEDTIPPQLTEIGSFVFYNCQSLKKVNLNNIQIIGMASFKYCYSLTNIECGSSLTDIYGEAFESCYDLKSFTTTSESFSIAKYAFTFCQSLQQFDFYKCRDIQPNAFQNSGIIEANLSLCPFTTVETELFLECQNLVSISFPKKLLLVASTCFMNCASLTKLEFFNCGGHFSLAKEAFQGCTSLKSVVFETQPSMLFENCFNGCSQLETVTLLNVTLPKNGTAIGQYCFYNCTSLTNFAFDKWTLTMIQQAAFAFCPLQESISFIGTVSPLNFTIYDGAFQTDTIRTVDFRNCKNLQMKKNSFMCENITCVMIDEQEKWRAQVAFTDDVINGIDCPNDPTEEPTIEPTPEPKPDDSDKKKKTIIIASSVSAVVLVIILVIIVVIVIRKRKHYDLATKLLLTQENPIQTAYK